MGPSTRQCKTGEILNFKLMFINRMDNRRQTPIRAGAGKPIRIFMYVNEAEAEENEVENHPEGIHFLESYFYFVRRRS